MKDLLKNYVSTRRKKSLGFVPARKSVSTTRNEAFAEKYISTIRKNCFFWQTKKRFPPAGKIFSVKIDSAQFQSWFPTAEKCCKQKQIVSTRQKIPFH